MYSSQILAQRIKDLTKRNGIQLGDMLKEVGLSVNAISQISDKKGLSSFSLAHIADYLDCSVDYLLGRTDCESISQSPADSVSFDPQADRMMDAFMQLDADNRDIVLGKAKELLKEQRYEEENGDIRLAK